MFEEEVVHEDKALLEEQHVIEDEGYQSKLDCSTCKKSLIVKIEESYKQQIASLESKLIQQQNRIDKYYYANELTDNEENVFEGKGKGYVKQAYDLKPLALKQQYLSKIKCEKRCFRFLQLDDKTQLIICKINALKGPRSDNTFIDDLLETFERNSFQLLRLNKTIGEMKELEDEYIKTCDEFKHNYEKTVEEKDQEIDYFRKNMKVVLVGEGRCDFLGEPSKKKKNGKKCKKNLKTDESEDGEYQITIANMEGLRELDGVVYYNVVKMLGWKK